MPYHYTTGDAPHRKHLPHLVNRFEFYRYRFHLRAAAPVHFPAGKSANVVRGAFGVLLRDTAAPSDYARLFEPRTPPAGGAPSGLADWPRPFVFRAAHLDGRTIPPGDTFHFDAHVFETCQAAATLAQFRAAFAELARSGIGAGRSGACLERIEQLDLEGGATIVDTSPLAPCTIALDPDTHPVEHVGIRFLTPTELKLGGELAERPEFPILFARLRDRLSTLRALYGPGPLDIDFRAMGEHAESIRLERCELKWERVERRSGRTGQVHSIGGFTGDAEYAGPLREFLPWLRAARWVGVGRQTVWGKGEVQITGEG